MVFNLSFLHSERCVWCRQGQRRGKLSAWVSLGGLKPLSDKEQSNRAEKRRSQLIEPSGNLSSEIPEDHLHQLIYTSQLVSD